MELKEVIAERRSVRHYNNKKISKETIEDILEHAILAPSAKNRQPWHFIVVTQEELKEKVADMLLEASDETVNQTCIVLNECAAFVLVFAKIEDLVMDVQSVGAAIENMVLRARDLDVASLWIGYILKIEKELQEEFATDRKLIACIALGHTDHYPSKRPRKTLEEVSEWY